MAEYFSFEALKHAAAIFGSILVVILGVGTIANAIGAKGRAFQFFGGWLGLLIVAAGFSLLAAAMFAIPVPE